MSNSSGNAKHFEFDQPGKHIRSGWNTTAMLVRGRLTDKKIAQYAKRGWYSSEYRAARRERMKSKHSKRVGAFLVVDGRMIYSP